MDNKKIKLYVAILNKGWIRREYISVIIPAIMQTKGIEVVLEDPGLTYSHPICSNRSLITKRFLETDCTHLLMIDCDVVPIHNPAELVFANQDIVGSPARVRRGKGDGYVVDWVAYTKVDKGYLPIPMETIDAKIDLLEVDVVGTGCIMVKRKVLETLKPIGWIIKFDEIGNCVSGTDFAFCERAKEAGFHVYTTPNRLCEHFKELGMLELESRSNIDGMHDVPAKFGMSWGGYAIDAKDWKFLRDIILETKAQTILEFGSGLSTLLMLTLPGIEEINCYETDDKWCGKIRSVAIETGLVYKLDMNTWDGKELDLPEGSRWDLAFVDGPKGIVNGGVGREKAVEIAAKYAKHIVLHDSGRNEEATWQAKYLKNDFCRVMVSGYHQQRSAHWVRR